MTITTNVCFRAFRRLGSPGSWCGQVWSLVDARLLVHRLPSSWCPHRAEGEGRSPASLLWMALISLIRCSTLLKPSRRGLASTYGFWGYTKQSIAPVLACCCRFMFEIPLSMNVLVLGRERIALSIWRIWQNSFNLGKTEAHNTYHFYNRNVKSSQG